MSKKIASLTATIGADVSGFEAGSKKVKSALDHQAAAFAKFSADATRNAKSYVAYEAQKAKAIAATERAAAKLAKEEERAAKAAARAAELQRKQALIVAPGLEKAISRTQEWTRANQGLISAATLGAAALTGLAVGYKKVLDKAVEYGDQVTKLKTITGQSAEETSRQIQLADDLRVEYDTLARSLQFASKKGVDTSIDGLMQLSNQYKNLAPGIERTKFLTDTFGKSGVEMAKILEMDSAALRKLADSQPEGLILNEQDLAELKAYNQALDQFSDTWSALLMSFGKSTVPFVTRAMGELNSNIEESGSFVGLLRFGFDDLWRAATGGKAAITDETGAIEDMGDESLDASESLEQLAETQQQAEETAKRLSQTYGGLLSSMFTIQKEMDNYEKTTADLAKKDEELAAKKQQLTYEWYQQQAAGKDTEEAMLDYMKSIDEVTRAESENAQAKIQLEEDREKAAKQREYDLAKERLSVDGLTSAEFEGLQTVAVQKGLVSKAAADQAIAESRAADMIIEAMGGTVQAMNETEQAMMAIRALGGTVQFGVNFSSNVPRNYSVPGASYNRPNPQASPGGYGYAASRDTGGPGMAGTPYMIGTGAQPEMFIPDTNGTFVPNANNKMGTTYNIVVNNPKRETAENSIRASLKKLSYIGVAA